MNELLVDMQGFIDKRVEKAVEKDLTYKQAHEDHHALYKQLGAVIGDNPEAKAIWFDLDGAHNMAEAKAAYAAYTQGFIDGLKMIGKAL